MSEEEIIKILQEIIQKNQQVIKEAYKNKDINTMQLVADIDNEAIAIQGLLDLYNKEKRNHQMTKNNYKGLIADVSTIAEKLELEEDATIDEILEQLNKEKEKNKKLEEENSFLKQIYRGTEEFKAIEKLANKNY